MSARSVIMKTIAARVVPGDGATARTGRLSPARWRRTPQSRLGTSPLPPACSAKPPAAISFRRRARRGARGPRGSATQSRQNLRTEAGHAEVAGAFSDSLAAGTSCLKASPT